MPGGVFDISWNSSPRVQIIIISGSYFSNV
jgi:hypothetical protein